MRVAYSIVAVFLLLCMNRAAKIGNDAAAFSKRTTNDVDHYNDEDNSDEVFMDRAIYLATLANGRTRPNPIVGCVIVDVNGKIVGEGFHEKSGCAHAEVQALSQAKEQARGGTAYVSLEPCNHYGRTPPCTLALIKHGIRRVVAGMVDPDFRVAGMGLKFLKDAGLIVRVGVKEELCKEINAPYTFRVLNNRPYGIVVYGLNSILEMKNCNFTAIFDAFNKTTPEVDTVILTFKQFLDFSDYSKTIDCNSMDKHVLDKIFPSHVNIGIVDWELQDNLRKHGSESVGRNNDSFHAQLSRIISIITSKSILSNRKWLLINECSSLSADMNRSQYHNITFISSNNITDYDSLTRISNLIHSFGLNNSDHFVTPNGLSSNAILFLGDSRLHNDKINSNNNDKKYKIDPTIIKSLIQRVLVFTSNNSKPNKENNLIDEIINDYNDLVGKTEIFGDNSNGNMFKVLKLNLKQQNK
eukprot:gene5884-8114_t